MTRIKRGGQLLLHLEVGLHVSRFDFHPFRVVGILLLRIIF